MRNWLWISVLNSQAIVNLTADDDYYVLLSLDCARRAKGGGLNIFVDFTINWHILIRPCPFPLQFIHLD